MDELIAAKNITVAKRSDPRRVIIQNISLNVEKNEILGIVGESGSGKTTTALALTGMLPASLVLYSGCVTYNGKNIYDMRQKYLESLLGKETAFIFQDPSAALNPVLKIGAQIAERLVIFSNFSKAEIKERVLTACAEAGLPATTEFLKKYPHELSGGMKQRVMIAGAIVHSPRVIIADEPTASLDSLTAKGILHLIKDVHKKHGCSIVFISHDLDAVQQLCSRICVIHKGEIQETADAANFFARPKNAQTQIMPAAARQAVHAPSPVVTVEHLYARYTNRIAAITGQKRINTPGGDATLKDISLVINKKEIFALIGQSGSGKTTLARTLSGIIPFSGSYTIDGKDFSTLSQKQKSRLVQIVFQNPYTSLNPSRTVRDIVQEPLVIHRVCPKREREARAREMLKNVSLDGSFLTRYPRELSGGERQRIAIAASLMLDPKLLIADEILSALDAAVQIKIIDLLLELHERLGFSILFITHNISQALSFCSKIAVMKDGRIIETVLPEKIAQGGNHEYTKELFASAF